MSDRKTVLALGFFDGIHVGHAALVDMAKQRAEQIGAEPAVMTFDLHPDTIIKVYLFRLSTALRTEHTFCATILVSTMCTSCTSVKKLCV